jgi:hypothetical protein
MFWEGFRFFGQGRKVEKKNWKKIVFLSLPFLFPLFALFSSHLPGDQAPPRRDRLRVVFGRKQRVDLVDESAFF